MVASTLEIRSRLAARVRMTPLGEWPTPVHEIAGLDLGTDRVRPWVKREDRSSSIGGGNKVRKLELLLAGAPGPVVTFGARGSHHVLATALHAARLGRPCAGVMVAQPPGEHVEETFRATCDACAVALSLDPRAAGVEGRSGGAGEFALAAIRARNVTVIPPGGSSPLGTLGYVLAALELAEQIAAGACPAPTAIYLPLGTGGTAAGLALGLALVGISTRVIAVRVASRLTGNAAFLRVLAGRAARLGGLGPVPALCLEVRDEMAGPGYGRESFEGRAAMARLSSSGLSLEPTYTAKAAAALLADVDAGRARGAVMLLDTFGPMEHVRAFANRHGRSSHE